MKNKLEISIFRKKIPFIVHKNVCIAPYLFHLLDRYEIDWDVYLPSKDKNLQRSFVWTLEQKQELIYSMLKGVNIPNITIIEHDFADLKRKHILKIIDGKQRLSTMLSFYKGEFPIIFNNLEYFYDDLAESSQDVIRYYTVLGDKAYEGDDDMISDDDKIAWFELINFSGTPQDKEHLLNLKK